MDQNHPIADLRPLAKEIALANVAGLSAAQAHEIWHAMQLIAINESLQGLPGPVVQLAMELNHFLNAWKVVAEKALAHERLSGKQKSRGFWVR